MQSVPERDATAILAKLRSGADVETLVSHIVNGDLLLQLSVAPEARSRYDFPYDKRMPANLVIEENTYLLAPIFEQSFTYAPSAQANLPRAAESTWPSHSSAPSQVATKETIYLRPFHAAEVIDPRISDLNIASWTTVCDDNVLMRDLLCRWLRCEYHFTAAVQLDLFLEDMAAMRESFCSSLLVNAVLAYACV